jgi:hypothetical protein
MYFIAVFRIKNEETTSPPEKIKTAAHIAVQEEFESLAIT